MLELILAAALWTQPVQEPVTTTGYCWHYPCVNKKDAHGITKSGTRVQMGVCASSWSVFPRGSYWFVPGYGVCRVEDTGRLVQGRHLDLYFDRIDDARQWGRKQTYIRRVVIMNTVWTDKTVRVMVANETPSSVGEWATEQFGTPTPLAILRRMCDEVLEGMELCVLENEHTRTMFKAFRMGLNHLDTYAHSLPHQMRLVNPISDELADAHIVGYHAASILGVTLFDKIDRKMEINRRRRWKSNVDGTGQHVDEDVVLDSIDQEADSE